MARLSVRKGWLAGGIGLGACALAGAAWMGEHAAPAAPPVATAPAAVSVRQNVFAGVASSLFVEPLSWLGRMSVIIPLLLLVGGMVGIYQFEQEQHIAELAEIDAAVLSDELPLSAYMDHGFNAYLTKREQ